jgi:microcystin-dependent protein
MSDEERTYSDPSFGYDGERIEKGEQEILFAMGDTALLNAFLQSDLDARGFQIYNLGGVLPPTTALPTGSILDFAGSLAPGGFLLCDGAAVDRTIYAALYAALGSDMSPWGQGDGSSTFNVPDLRGRVPVGAGTGSGLTNRALAATGGEENHALSIAELAAHTHVQNAHTHVQNSHTHAQNAHGHNDNGHTHPPGTGTGYRMLVGTGGSGASTAGAVIATAGNTGIGHASIATTTATNQAAVASNQDTTATNQNTGSGTGHNTMPPFVVLNRIIKT